jgi:hypothetical protein
MIGQAGTPRPINRQQRRALFKRLAKSGETVPTVNTAVCPICNGKQYLEPSEQVRFKFFYTGFPVNISCPACNADGKGY